MADASMLCLLLSVLDNLQSVHHERFGASRLVNRPTAGDRDALVQGLLGGLQKLLAKLTFNQHRLAGTRFNVSEDERTLFEIDFTKVAGIVEKGHEELELLFLPVVRGCDRQKEVAGQARPAFAPWATAGKEELMGLVADDEIPPSVACGDLGLDVLVPGGAGAPGPDAEAGGLA